MPHAFDIDRTVLETVFRESSDVDAYSFASLGQHPASFSLFCEMLFAGPNPAVRAPASAPLAEVRVEPDLRTRELVVRVYSGPHFAAADPVALDAFATDAVGWEFAERVLDRLEPLVDEAFERLMAAR